MYQATLWKVLMKQESCHWGSIYPDKLTSILVPKLFLTRILEESRARSGQEDSFVQCCLCFFVPVVHWPGGVLCLRAGTLQRIQISHLQLLNAADFISSAYRTWVHPHCFHLFCPCLPPTLSGETKLQSMEGTIAFFSGVSVDNLGLRKDPIKWNNTKNQ